VGFSYSCDKNAKCNFDGSASRSSAGIKSYQWTFGDGATSKPSGNAKASHDYSGKGTYSEVVTLTVVDKAGASNSQTQTINIVNAR
jgi:PKD repeat protein